MATRRPGPPTPWREWFFSLLLGVGLALVCILFLTRRQAPAAQTAPEQTRAQPSVGLELNFSVRILLPERKDG